MNIFALIAAAITLVVVVLVWCFVRRPLITALVAFAGFWVTWSAASGWTWIFIAMSVALGLLVVIGRFKSAAAMAWPFKWFAMACVAGAIIGALASSGIGGVRPESAAAATPSPTATIDTAVLAQCRVDAITAYMTEQGFTDGDYVIGEERIDTSLSEFSRQGSLGFRQGDTLPETREQLAELFASTDENVKLAIDAQVRKFPDIGQETLLDVNNWEIVQTTVTSVVQGNSGLSGNVQVSVGDTTSEAGDAAWVFIDTTSCEVARSYITATGVELPADTDKSDLPVAALRPGCINPTDGFKPVPPPEPEPEPTCPPNTTPWPECNDLKWVEDSPTEEGWDQRGTDNGLTDGQQSAEQIVSGETRGNAVDDQVADTPATNTGGTTKDTVPSDQGGPVAENATSGGDDQQHGAVDPENTNRDSGGVEGDTCVPDVITGITC